MLTAIQLTTVKTESPSGKPLLLHPSTRVVHRDDLRMPVLPRHVRLLIGEELFYGQNPPLV